MRIIPADGLRNADDASAFLSEEIRDLQESGEDAMEITVGVRRPGSVPSQGPTIDKRVITLRRDDQGGEAIIVEGLGNPIRLIMRKNGVGTVQLMHDEISGTFSSESIGRN
ncbi:MAG: hypothetical protein OK474_04520 [Thaumarchaeota archaeon]|nr:hypothetical protein [Nitrososphaerota archaeon]